MNGFLSLLKKNISLTLVLVLILEPIPCVWASKKGKEKIQTTEEENPPVSYPASKKRTKNKKDSQPSSFDNPIRSHKLEPYSLLNVDYRVKKPADLPELYDQYTLGPIVGDGNCFIHAAFTNEGQTLNEMTKFSETLRSSLTIKVMSNNRFKKMMRRELLAECKTNSNYLKDKTQGHLMKKDS
jgi:hypothetical protein